MPPGYVFPLAIGAVVYLFAEDVVTARRFGPVTDGARSSETGGLAFRILGLLVVGVGVLEFARPVLSL
ncbi:MULTISPECIES: hypothetical protein [Halorussus]|uniref:hypothetical protein n=1 Tax=Halorussus TaxID=1070314 RepID=UPI000E212C5A|nr:MULTISPECIES: hypothetical protein [Halorussus]NHN58853.1 hypothetical protein [Halorussus sp. JP-T4]